MKFENIEVGDKVLLPTPMGGYSHRSFLLPEKVVRVTATRFKLEGGLQFTKCGRPYGAKCGYRWATPYGEALDESEKYANYVHANEVANELHFIFEKTVRRFSASLDNLEKLSRAERDAIKKAAAEIQQKLGAG